MDDEPTSPKSGGALVNWDLIFSNALYSSINAFAAATCLIAVGLNVHVGYTGLLNFGQAGFAAVGAYAFAIPIIEYDWPWYAALGLVVVCSIALSLVLGLPTLRLRADYLAIVTIAAAEIIRYFVSSTRFTWLTGGTDGRQGWTEFFSDLNPWIDDDRFWIGAQTFDGYRLWMMVFCWAMVAVVSVFVWALMRSPWGRVLKSIREDEDAARALGKNVVAFKMQSLVLGGLIGSLGGLMLAAQTQAATPNQFAPNLTFICFTVIIIGGLGRAKGPIVGTMIFFFVYGFVDTLLSQATRNDKIPDWLVAPDNFSQVKFIVAGLALGALVVFRPQGIFGDRREQVFDVR